MSIFITSPYLFYLFTFKYKEKILKLLWLASFIIGLPIFFYYGVGYSQFGYRYSLDFLHLIFLIFFNFLQEEKRGVSKNFKILVFLSSISTFLM